jgi:hypothetical protein
MYCIWADPRFWVSVASALFTLGAVLVALFLRELRAKFRPPILKIDLARPNGLSVSVDLYPPHQAIPVNPRREKSRYYHVRVSNPRRKADVVNGVTVTLLRVERRGADGVYHETWSGDIPVVWRNETKDTERRIVGTWADADLCSVVKDKWLELHVRIVPNDLETRYAAGEAPIDLAVTVQARGNEVDSDAKRWRIVWDGKWEDGELEMRKHFSVATLEENENPAVAVVSSGDRSAHEISIKDRPYVSSSTPQHVSTTFTNERPANKDPRG